jgi:hypothetical protein
MSVYVVTPTIPAGMTVSEYRRSRPHTPRRWAIRQKAVAVAGSSGRAVCQSPRRLLSP